MIENGVFTGIHMINFWISLNSGSSGNEGVSLFAVGEKKVFSSVYFGMKVDFDSFGSGVHIVSRGRGPRVFPLER